MCFLSEVGIPRALDPIDINEEPLRYHAEGVAEFTTIFATSVLYNFRQGRPTPQYHSGATACGALRQDMLKIFLWIHFRQRWTKKLTR